jgi:hypothetical protein
MTFLPQYSLANLILIRHESGIDAQGTGSDRSFAAGASKRAQAGLVAQRPHFARHACL